MRGPNGAWKNTTGIEDEDGYASADVDNGLYSDNMLYDSLSLFEFRHILVFTSASIVFKTNLSPTLGIYEEVDKYTLDMHDPADLPPELFNIVLGHVLADRGLKHLCSLSLLSRQWHHLLLPVIYSKWTYDGADHSFSSLWSFLITVLRNKHIASMVRTLVIGNWGFNPYAALGEEFTHTIIDKDAEYIRGAIRSVGIPAPGVEEFFTRLSLGDRRPLVALLLASLPNVTAIDAHIPQSDPVLGAVFRVALESQRKRKEDSDAKECIAPATALARLKTLRLWGEVYIHTDPDLSDYDDFRAPVYLNDIWPALFFPRLELLSLTEVDFMNAQELLEEHNKDNKCSNVRHLTLVQRQNTFRGWDPQGTVEDFEAFMAIFPAGLKSFSFHCEDPAWYGPHRKDPNLCVPNPVLRQILEQHANSLENLDICRKVTGGSEEMGRLGPLPALSRIIHLYIQPAVLFGPGEADDPSLSLRDVLPSSPTLQSLTLYCPANFESLRVNNCPKDNILIDNTFSNLRTLRLQSLGIYARDSTPEWAAFEAALRRADINLSVVDTSCWIDKFVKDCELPRGGSCPAFWEESYRFRESGQCRWHQVKDEIESEYE
ncbi:hypothetical protein BJX64DRAFT_291673 [Aspergillus heterothallicus]